MSNLPTPVTREEIYLNAIAQGSGGGGVSSADDVSYDNTTSGLNATNVQDAIDELAQGSGGTSQPDFVLSGTCDSTPDATDISGALDNIVFNSTISDMVTKATATGGLDVGGCFTNGDLSTTGVTVFKSMIDYNSTVEVLPSSVLPPEYGVTSDYAVLLYLTTAISQASVKVGIAEIGGTLMCVPLGG